MGKCHTGVKWKQVWDPLPGELDGEEPQCRQPPPALVPRAREEVYLPPALCLGLSSSFSFSPSLCLSLFPLSVAQSPHSCLGLPAVPQRQPLPSRCCPAQHSKRLCPSLSPLRSPGNFSLFLSLSLSLSHFLLALLSVYSCLSQFGVQTSDSLTICACVSLRDSLSMTLTLAVSGF